MRATNNSLFAIIDMLMLPAVYPAAFLMKRLRAFGLHRLPRTKSALLRVGVFPVRNHYYEPQFDYGDEEALPGDERILPGIDLNQAGQLKNLERLVFSEELADTPQSRSLPNEFHVENGAFEAGDAEFLYQMIRAYRPKRLFEIGSGHSTLMARRAIERNLLDDSDYSCEHVCIEPYEMPWLESAGPTIVRRRVENLDISFFEKLQENDILFIDSSHIIRPNGDVLFEYLQVLPSLQKGVIVHIHDIFTPRNYPRKWLVNEVRFWNEQYLLEAFLTENPHWEVLGALNYLHHNHHKALKAVAPFLTPGREPGSLYIRKSA